MAEDKKSSLVDRWLVRLKNHPIIASLIIVAVALSAIESSAESVSKLFTNAKVAVEALGWIPSEEIKCWDKSLKPTDPYVPGIRVIERTTTLDLSSWKKVSEDDLAKSRPVERATSRNEFLIDITDEKTTCFIQRIGTSSGIEPTVHCSRCRKVARPKKEGSPLREWDLVFDVSDQKIGVEFPLLFSYDYWNAFQRPDQWWGGVRIIHSTEKSNYTVIFPKGKKPKIDSLQYKFVRSPTQTPENMTINSTDLKISSDEGLAESVTWTVLHPLQDRSYRVYWTW